MGVFRTVQHVDCCEDVARIAGWNIDALTDLRADRKEDSIETTGRSSSVQVVNLRIENDLHAHGFNPGDFLGQRFTRQAIGRNAIAHHAARLRVGFADLHGMTEPAQMIGCRQTARPRAHNEHPFAAGWGNRNRPAMFAGQIAKVSLHRMNADCAVELSTVAACLAGVIADPAVDGGQRIVLDKFQPSLLKSASLSMREPGLNILAGRAGVVAGR